MDPDDDASPDAEHEHATHADTAERLQRYLDRVLQAVRRGHSPDTARVALPPADPDLMAVSVCATDGTVVTAGDRDHVFPLQSVSKSFVYALVLETYGIDAVLERVDVEPSGEAYDMFSLEEGSRRPDNPMINAGAMTIHSMIGSEGLDAAGRTPLVVDGLSRMAGRPLEVDHASAAEEFADSHRNLAIAHLLRAERVLTGDPEDVVRGYLDQCWVQVTAGDLAVMAATLACGGVQPVTGERVVSAHVARHTLSVMMTCGMYDSAGDWMSEVGIPAKSGVSGAIMGALPGRVGLAAYSPRLDHHGTSVRAQAVFEQMVDDLGLHLLDDPLHRRSGWQRLTGQASSGD